MRGGSSRAASANGQLTRRGDAAARLKTVEGQLRGVRRMVEEGADCLEIANQAAAALQGLRGAMKIVLRNYMDDCLEFDASDARRDAAFDEFVSVLERFIR